MPFQTKNIIVNRCIQLLIDKGIISSFTVVQNVNLSPLIGNEIFDLAIRVCEKPSHNEDELLFSDSLIRRCVFIGPYINIDYNRDYLIRTLLYSSNEIDLKDAYKNEIFVIEHTSLTPVYPIELSTYRTTLVGDVLMSIFKECNLMVDNNFFVSDDARQLDLLEKIGTRQLLTLDSYLNADRKDIFFGKLFLISLFKSRGSYQEELINSLNDLYGDEPLEKEDIEKIFKYSETDDDQKLSKKQISKLVVSGYELFFRQYHHQPMNYTYFSDIGSGDMNYEESNSAYYNHLLKKYSKVISVVSRRQEDVLKPIQKSFDDKVSIIYVNDVELLDEQGNRIKDKPSHLIHNIFDRYFDKLYSYYPNYSRDVILKAFKLYLLSKRFTEKIILPQDGNVVLDDYLVILNIADSINKGGESIYKANDVVEKICEFENIINKVVSTFDVHLLIDYLVTTTKLICDFHIDDSLRRIIVSHYRELIRLLGI